MLLLCTLYYFPLVKQVSVTTTAAVMELLITNKAVAKSGSSTASIRKKKKKKQSCMAPLYASSSRICCADFTLVVRKNIQGRGMFLFEYDSILELSRTFVILSVLPNCSKYSMPGTSQTS